MYVSNVIADAIATNVEASLPICSFLGARHCGCLDCPGLNLGVSFFNCSIALRYLLGSSISEPCNLGQRLFTGHTTHHRLGLEYFPFRFINSITPLHLTMGCAQLSVESALEQMANAVQRGEFAVVIDE